MLKRFWNFLLTLPTGISLFLLSFFFTLGCLLPFTIVQYYSVTYKPCGDTWAALWCTVPLAILALFFTFIFFLGGLMKIILFLRQKKTNNILLILITQTVFVLFLIAAAGFDPFIIFSYKTLILIPLITLFHYYLFTSVKINLKDIRPSFISLIIWSLILMGGFAIVYTHTQNEYETLESKYKNSYRAPNQSPQPTNSASVEKITNSPWKTYRSETYNFEFSYPPDHYLSEDLTVYDRGNGFKNILGLEIGIKLNDFEYSKYYFDITENAELLDKESFFKKRYEPADYGSDNPFDKCQKSELIPDKKRGDYYSFSNCNCVTACGFDFFFNKDKVYSFTNYYTIKSDYIGENIIYQQILSSFRYLDQQQNELISGWETYKNNKYQFQISYPDNYRLEEDLKNEDYYDYLGKITDGTDSISLRAIYNIGIYENRSPEVVAEREIMDSGYNYKIYSTKIGDYSAAFTPLKSSGVNYINPENIMTIFTVAHPSKNLFIEIECRWKCLQFDRILKTLKFTD